MWKRKRKENITAVVKYVCCLVACGYCSEAWILFCVWWWFSMLECYGLSVVRGSVGRDSTDGGSL